MQWQSKATQVAFSGLMLALTLVLSYVESLLPLTIGIPGVKLGLANLAVLLTLYASGWRMALGIDVLRVVLSGFLFGNFAAILYSMAGALVSFGAMVLLKRFRFSMSTVSIAGGVFHNLGQLVVAVCVVENIHLFYYLPWLIVAGVITGALIGIVARVTWRYVNRMWQEAWLMEEKQVKK